MFVLVEARANAVEGQVALVLAVPVPVLAVAATVPARGPASLPTPPGGSNKFRTPVITSNKRCWCSPTLRALKS